MIEVDAVGKKVGCAIHGESAGFECAADCDDLIDLAHKFTFHLIHDDVIAAGPNGEVVDAVINPFGRECLNKVGSDGECCEDDSLRV